MNDPDQVLGICGLFVVGYFDVIGQRDMAKEWSNFNDAIDKDSEAFKSMIRTVKIVQRVREDFTQITNGFLDDDKSENVQGLEDLSKTRPHMAKFWKDRPPLNIGRMSFSDTNIWFSSVGNEQIDFSSREITGIVIGMGFAQLLSLFRGVICRGSLTVGVGSDILGSIDGGAPEIYGPVLVDAYKLESEKADYPRIIASDALVTLITNLQIDISEVDNESPNFPKMAYHSINFGICREMFFKDTDGAFALDYAGIRAASTFKRIMVDMDLDPAETFAKTIEFIKKEINRHTENRNFKLTLRNKRVLEYLESRSEHWQ